jgi:archaellum component FlaC
MIDQFPPLDKRQIAFDYAAALNSVDIVNALVDKKDLSDDELERLDQNVKHLENIVARDYWTTQDLTPFYDAIKKGSNF